MKKFILGLLILLSVVFLSFGLIYSNPGVTLPKIPPADSSLQHPKGLSWFSRAALDLFFDVNIWRGADSGYVAMFAKDGHVIHATARGMADIDKSIPMNIDTRFRIASMTKPVTAVATLILVEEGKLRLDDPIAKYIPLASDIRVAVDMNRLPDGTFLTEPPARPITVFDLLTFSSGAGHNNSVDYISKTSSDLAGLWEDNDIYDGTGPLGDRVNRIIKIPFYEQPGKIWRYGWSTDILARVIEVASEQPFNQFLDEKIFKPLEMGNTNFLSMENSSQGIAEVYSRNDSGNLMLIDTPRSNPLDWTPGSSGLVSNVGDYMKFALMLWNQGEYNGTKILSADSISLMTYPHVDVGVLTNQVDGLGFGLGIGVVIDADRSTPIDRNGDYFWSGFYGTNFFVSPDTGLVGVIMSQNQPPESSPWPGSYGVFIAPAFAFYGL